MTRTFKLQALKARMTKEAWCSPDDEWVQHKGVPGKLRTLCGLRVTSSWVVFDGQFSHLETCEQCLGGHHG
tara:strand:+ start:3558 stop:3770 length:213 start_codon:yes stop_codon:yes gene_type:complete